MNSRLTTLIQPVSIILRNNLQGRREFHRWLAPTLKALKHKKDKLGPEPPVKRSDFIEWNYKAEIYAFGKRLGEDFEASVLKQAFIEDSYVEKEAEKQEKVGLEPDTEIETNTDMALDGQAVIEKYVRKYLKTTLPHLPNQYIRAIEEFLLSTETLAHISKHIGIDDLVLSAEFPPEQETLARSLKGVVQALVLSSGEERASLFIRDFVLTQIAGRDLTPFCTPQNPLRELAQILQEKQLSPPEPRLIAAMGKNTILANYQVGIYCDRQMIGKGCGESVEIAQDMAACDALWRLWGVSSNKRPFPFNIQLPLKTSRNKHISAN